MLLVLVAHSMAKTCCGLQTDLANSRQVRAELDIKCWITCFMISLVRIIILLQHLLVDSLQLAHQRVLLPENEGFLVTPITALRAEFDIKVVVDLGSKQADLVVCHTKSTVSLLSTGYVPLRTTREGCKLTSCRHNP